MNQARGYTNYILFAALFANALLLILYIGELSISANEAKIVFESEHLLAYFARFFLELFGYNDYALRLPFVLIHIVNATLLYLISKKILKKPQDSLIALFLYILLPGILTSALLVSKSGIVTFFLLLFIFTYFKNRKISLLLLPFYAVLDTSFSALFLALFFYFLYKKRDREIVFTLLLFTINMYIFGFDDGGGKPKGHFLDTIGAYAAIFSPLLFVYLFYSLYRTLIKEDKNIIWFLSFCALAISILLSFRQKVDIENFAPYIVIATPLMLKTFLNGLRVRLPEFRKKYKIISFFVLTTLLLSVVVAFINKPFYHFYSDSKKHFAYKYQIAKDLALRLKEDGIDEISSDDRDLLLRLKFYGIEQGESYFISQRSVEKAQEVSIFYTSKRVASFYVTKLPKN